MPMTPNVLPYTVSDLQYGSFQNLAERDRQLESFNKRWLDRFQYGIPGAAIGAIDTVLQSVTPEELVDDETVTRYIQSLNEPLGRYYKRNREGLQTLGEIPTAFIPIIGATKLIRAGSFLERMAKQTKLGDKYGKYIFSTGKSNKDFIDQIDKEMALFVDNKGLSINEWGDEVIDKMVRNAKITSGVDMLKESLASDLAIAAFFNDSDMFFPDDLGTLTNTAMFLVPDAALSGLAYRFTGTAIKQHLQATWAEKVAQALNVMGEAGTRSVSVPGHRGPEASWRAMNVLIAEEDMAKGAGTALATSGNQRKDANNKLLVEQIIDMFKDDPFKHGISQSKKVDAASGMVQLLRMAGIDDPTLLAGVRSAEELTQKMQTQWPANLKKRMTTITNKQKVLQDDFDAAARGVVVEKIDEKRAEFDALQSELNELKAIQSAVVVETDRSITQLAKRKWSILDNQPVFDDALKMTSDAGEKIYTFKKSFANELGIEIGVTEHGKILIAAKKKEDADKVFGGINLTTVLPKTAEQLQIERQEMKLTLRDISQDWHYRDGRHGSEIFSQLSPELQTAVRNWTSSSHESSTPIRKWFRDNDPRAEELIKAYREGGLHQRLHEIADPDGTITLWRGETREQNRLGGKHDVVSMAIEPGIAQSFNEVWIKRRVPVEDVIMVVGGLDDEAEYIVKGNLKRNTQAVGRAVDDAVDALDWNQATALYGLMQKALDNFSSTTPVYVHADSSHLELDFAYQLMKKKPGSVQVIQGGRTVDNAEDALLWQLIQAKAKEYQKYKTIQNAQRAGVLRLKESQVLSDYDVTRLVNMPNPTAGGQKHPMQLAFDEVMPDLGQEIIDLKNIYPDLATFEAAMARHVDSAKLGEKLKNDYKVTGSMLMHNHDPSLKPAVLISQDRYVGRIGREELQRRMTANKLYQSELIRQLQTQDPKDVQTPLHRAIYEELLSRPDHLKIASRPDLIIEGLQKNLGIFGQQSEIMLDGSPTKVMDTLKSIADRRALQMINQIFRGPDGEYTKTFNKILSSQNAASLETFNIAINSLQHGWKLKKKPVDLGDGLWAFALDRDWKFNDEQYRNLFGKGLDDAEEVNGEILMPVRGNYVRESGADIKPAAVDELALKTLSIIVENDHRYLRELNFDRKLRGLQEIKQKEWHIPVVNLSKGYTVYLADSTGHLKQMVNRPTKAEAIRVANQELEAATKDGRDWIKVDDFTVRQYHETMGDIWDEPKNFAWAEFQTGTTKGKLGSRTIQFGKGPLNAMLEQQQRNYEMLVRNTFATFFESELNYTRSHILADTFGDAGKRNSRALNHQQYERIILGKSALNSNGLVGKFYYAVESVADDFFRAAWDKLHAVKQPTAASLETEFGMLENKLKGYNPFQSSLDMLSVNENINMPPTLRKMLTKWNSFTTDMVLRILDMGMPIINFASLASVTPSVIAALKRLPNESYDSWVRRTNLIGTPVDDQFVMPNTTRLSLEGIATFFSEDYQRIRKLAADRGYIKQEVAERLNLWTSPHQGWLARNRDMIVDKLSWPTDWSETMSRDIAFGMMYSVARKTFQLAEEPAMLFAHTHANKVIGDFRPTNRPQMFQGAAGMPLGLFTTWAINWLQRVFGDVEAGRMGAVFWQGAMQQFLFGAQSFPGVQSFIDTFTTSYDGKSNVADSLDSMYGKEFTDWFLHGTLSSLTGVDFASRADVSMPALYAGEPLITAVPGVSVANTLAQGVGQLVSSMRQQGLDPDAISEILSVYGVNGFLRNMTQTLQNTSLDRHGATVENEIRTWENMIPRFMELKSVREQRKAREIQRDRMQREIQNGHITRLARQLKTAVRAGDIDAEMVEQGLLDYYAAGGEPTDYKRFVKEQILSAKFEKSSRLLLRALRQSDEQAQAARLMRLTGDDFGW